MSDQGNTLSEVVQALLGGVKSDLKEFKQTAKDLERKMHQFELQLVRVEENAPAVKDLSERVAKLENWRWFIIGLSTAAGAVAGILGKLLVG